MDTAEPAKAPLVTTLTTAFNSQRYLQCALQSLCEQTLTDIQILVVSDGSTDRSSDIAREMAATDPRIEVLDVARVGRSGALNLGLEAARAPYVAIMDADDLAHPERLEIQHEVLEENPEFVGVGAKAAYFRGNGSQLPPMPARTPPGFEDVTCHLRRHNPLPHSTMMFRRDPLVKLGGYDVRMLRQVDYELYVRLAAVGQRLARLEARLGGIRYHDTRNYQGGRQVGYRASSLVQQANALRVVPGSTRDMAYLPARAGFLVLRTVAPRYATKRAGLARIIDLDD
ncbi:MAG: glycosyltransferase [Acidimicrobiia bacterium]|nr:glycosyltransferase [Acidimicrobiia bacterium]